MLLPVAPLSHSLLPLPTTAVHWLRSSQVAGDTHRVRSVVASRPPRSSRPELSGLRFQLWFWDLDSTAIVMSPTVTVILPFISRYRHRRSPSLSLSLSRSVARVRVSGMRESRVEKKMGKSGVSKIEPRMRPPPFLYVLFLLFY